MKRYFSHYGRYLLAALLLSLVFCYPYLLKDFVSIEHDTFFHLSRITGMAERIVAGDWFPCIYPYKNHGFGYASPMFYNDLFMIIPALLYSAGCSLAFCYKFVIFSATFFSAYAMCCLIDRTSGKAGIAILISAAYLFANYRITDVYVRSAVGETMAFVFYPVLLSGLYEVLDQKKADHWPLVTIGLAGLLCCHNLSFLFGVVLFLVFFCIDLNRISKDQFISLCKAVLIAFLVTAWFTLPMIEQLSSNTFILNYYGASSDLSSGAMPLWKFFANQTIFGYGSNNLEKDRQMLLNIGCFLTFAPLTWFLVPSEEQKQQRFIKSCLILGYVMMLLPGDWIPWGSLAALRILQFPWRLEGLAMVLLTVPAAAGISHLAKKSWLPVVLCAAVTAEGVWHLAPAMNRTFGITSSSTYSDITEGRLTDPYYSATYMRVELAGGDYLPLNSPDFRGYSASIKNNDGTDTDIAYTKDGTALSFSIEESQTGKTYLLPLTWYKGYQVYHISSDGTKQKVTTFPSSQSIVSFYAEEAGDYICVYEHTGVQTFSRILSLASIAVLAVFRKKIR